MVIIIIWFCRKMRQWQEERIMPSWKLLRPKIRLSSQVGDVALPHHELYS